MAEVRVLLGDPRVCGLVVEVEQMAVSLRLDRKQVAIVLALMQRWLDQARGERER